MLIAAKNSMYSFSVVFCIFGMLKNHVLFLLDIIAGNLSKDRKVCVKTSENGYEPVLTCPVNKSMIVVLFKTCVCALMSCVSNGSSVWGLALWVTTAICTTMVVLFLSNQNCVRHVHITPAGL